MNDPMNPSAEKKIFVDEDWKTQVEREKAQAQQEPPKSPSAPAEAGKSPRGGAPLPPASLNFLAASLYSQALMSFGMMPHPMSGKAELDLPMAKHSIDMLDVLQQKTEGNRTDHESEQIEAMLHRLRLMYVQLNK